MKSLNEEIKQIKKEHHAKMQGVVLSVGFGFVPVVVAMPHVELTDFQKFWAYVRGDEQAL